VTLDHDDGEDFDRRPFAFRGGDPYGQNTEVFTKAPL
jgi:hypothetical protein